MGQPTGRLRPPVCAPVCSRSDPARRPGRAGFARRARAARTRPRAIDPQRPITSWKPGVEHELGRAASGKRATRARGCTTRPRPRGAVSLVTRETTSGSRTGTARSGVALSERRAQPGRQTPRPPAPITRPRPRSLDYAVTALRTHPRKSRSHHRPRSRRQRHCDTTSAQHGQDRSPGGHVRRDCAPDPRAATAPPTRSSTGDRVLHRRPVLREERPQLPRRRPSRIGPPRRGRSRRNPACSAAPRRHRAAAPPSTPARCPPTRHPGSRTDPPA